MSRDREAEVEGKRLQLQEIDVVVKPRVFPSFLGKTDDLVLGFLGLV